MNLVGNSPDGYALSNKSPVINMSQISSGMVLNNSRPERGGGNPMQQKNANSHSPNKNNRAAIPRGRNEQEQMLDIVERRGGAVPNNPPNLKGPSSTMSKAGEQILQATQSSQNNNLASSDYNPTPLKYKEGQKVYIDRSYNPSHPGSHSRFQAGNGGVQNMVGGAGGSGAHFGAIHMGGNMSFLKDNIMNNMQPKSVMM